MQRLTIDDVPHVPHTEAVLSDEAEAENSKALARITAAIRERRPRQPVGYMNHEPSTPEIYPAMISGRVGVRRY